MTDPIAPDADAFTLSTDRGAAAMTTAHQTGDVDREVAQLRADRDRYRAERNWLLADLDDAGEGEFRLLAQTSEVATAEVGKERYSQLIAAFAAANPLRMPEVSREQDGAGVPAHHPMADGPAFVHPDRVLAYLAAHPEPAPAAVNDVNEPRCVNCGCPEKVHGNYASQQGDFRCAGDFMQCPCAGYTVPASIASGSTAGGEEPRLCSDKAGFHEPHDYRVDPSDDDLTWCPGKAEPSLATVTARVVHKHWMSARAYHWCSRTGCEATP